MVCKRMMMLCSVVMMLLRMRMRMKMRREGMMLVLLRMWGKR